MKSMINSSEFVTKAEIKKHINNFYYAKIEMYKKNKNPSENDSELAIVKKYEPEIGWELYDSFEELEQTVIFDDFHEPTPYFIFTDKRGAMIFSVTRTSYFDYEIIDVLDTEKSDNLCVAKIFEGIDISLQSLKSETPLEVDNYFIIRSYKKYVKDRFCYSDKTRAFNIDIAGEFIERGANLFDLTLDKNKNLLNILFAWEQWQGADRYSDESLCYSIDLNSLNFINVPQRKLRYNLR